LPGRFYSAYDLRRQRVGFAVARHVGVPEEKAQAPDGHWGMYRMKICDSYSSHTHTHIYYIYTHMNIYIYMCVCMHIYMYMYSFCFFRSIYVGMYFFLFCMDIRQ